MNGSIRIATIAKLTEVVDVSPDEPQMLLNSVRNLVVEVVGIAAGWGSQLK